MSELVQLDLSTEVEAESSFSYEDDNSDDNYDRYLSDLWVGVALAFMVLSCVGCLCTAFLVHAFRKWRSRVAEARHVECGFDTESLPSYTVVAGLPSYEEAIEQLKRTNTEEELATSDVIDAPIFSRLSVGDLLEVYKVNATKK